MCTKGHGIGIEMNRLLWKSSISHVCSWHGYMYV